MKKVFAMIMVMVMMVGCMTIGASAKSETYTLLPHESNGFYLWLQSGQTVTINLRLLQDTLYESNKMFSADENVWTHYEVAVTNEDAPWWNFFRTQKNSIMLNRFGGLTNLLNTTAADQYIDTYTYTFTADKTATYSFFITNTTKDLPVGYTYDKKPIVQFSVN